MASRRLLRTKDEIGADLLAAIDEFQAVAPVLLAHETIAVEVEMKSIVVDDGGAVENPVRKGNGAAREDLAHRAVDARILGPFAAVDAFEAEARGALVDPRRGVVTPRVGIAQRPRDPVRVFDRAGFFVALGSLPEERDK